MAGKRGLARNPIPLIRLSNRGIATPDAVWNAPVGQASLSASGFSVGAVYYSAAAPTLPGTWMDLTSAVAWPPLKVSDYPALYAEFGPLAGKTSLNSATPVSTAVSTLDTPAVMFRGYAWGMRGNNVCRRTTIPFGTWTTMFTNANTPYWCKAMGVPSGNRLFVAGTPAASGGSAGYIRTIRDDTTASAEVSLGTYDNGGGVYCNIALQIVEVVPNSIYLALLGQAGPIYRTTDDGATWTQILSNLSSGTHRWWIAGWMSGSRVYLLGQAGAISYSDDNGLTWSVPNTSVPNAPAAIQLGSYSLSSNSGSRSFFVYLDLVARVGYAITQNPTTTFISWNLDNPTAGYTTLLPANSFPTNPNYHQFFGANGAMWSITDPAGAIKPGLWYALLSNPTNWVQALATPPIGDVSSSYGSTCPGCVDEGDGYLTFNNVTSTTPTTRPNAFQIANLTQTFDRYVAPAPGLPNGAKPWVRVA